MGLLDYMKLMDGEDPVRALGELAPDIHYLLALPGTAIRGTSKDDFADYIANRNPSERLHNVIKYSRDGDVELAYGVVTEKGTPTGAFLSAARLDADGKIVRYHSSFDTELMVTELDG